MQISILLFATLKDKAGTNRLSLTLPHASAALSAIRDALTVERPALSEALPSAVAAINQEFAFAEDVVHDGDEVAFFPPVSGGSGNDKTSESVTWPEFFSIASEPIDLNEMTRRITTPATGAVCLFSGYVRGQTAAENGVEQTIRLEYEAYEPMAVAKMRQVADEIRARWPLLQGIAMVQRVGVLAVSEPTVLIACASGHRDQGCFEAARYGIDRLKEIVPVWKKEVRLDGSHWVEGHHLPQPTDRASGAQQE